jgi:NADPH:quinone reductase-like Zn-dependent oxidoreductase
VYAGDPIELGAAADVYGRQQQHQQQQSPSPLVLLSSKSWLGHAEPAAGIVGVLHGLKALHQQGVLAISHLRTLNPMVGSILDSAAGQRGTSSRQWVMPRSAAGWASCAAAEHSRVVGTSAFAFQGTNAHVMLSSGSSSIVAVAGSSGTHVPWQRQRLWVLHQLSALAASVSVGPGQPGASARMVFQTSLSAPVLSMLWDHQVSGQVLLPGAAMLEAAAAAGVAALGGSSSSTQQQQLVLAGVTIHAPCVLPALQASAASGDAGSMWLQCEVQADTGAVQLASVNMAPADGAGWQRQVHLTSSVSMCTSQHQQQHKRVASAAAGVAWLHSLVHAAAASAAAGKRQRQQPHASSSVGLVSSVPAADAFIMHPALVDNAFQLGAAHRTSSRLLVPAAVEAVVVALGTTARSAPGQEGSRASFAAAASTELQADGKSSNTCAQLVAYDAAAPACRVTNLVAKQLPAVTPRTAPAEAGLLEGSDMLYQVAHMVSHPHEALAPGAAAALLGPHRFELQSAATGSAAAGMLPGAAISLVQSSLAAVDTSMAVQAVLPSHCSALATCTGSSSSTIGSAGVAGVLKALDQEASSWRISIMDSDRAGAAAAIGLSAAADAAGADGSGSVFGSSLVAGAELVPQLVRTAFATAPAAHNLVPEPRGSFGSLVPRAVALDQLSPGQVGVRVAAVGINFRDVLNVLGMYPGDPGAPGSDVAGVVVSSSSSSLAPGTPVFGLAVGALGTAVSCSEQTVVAMPGCLSFEAASSMPTVFITAQLALGAVTACGPADSVLVHAAAGGVGLAALQVLRWQGARPVATAGSPSKRVLLRSLGVPVVVGSRDSRFVAPLAALGGVDVVLNSLTSPGMVAGSLALLRRGGRFVEIGKRDIWSPAVVAGERPDVAYSLLAVDFLPDAAVQSALQQVAAGVAAGRLAPLPTVSYSLRAAAAALRQMSQARHVGKVVVSNGLSSSSSSSVSFGTGRVVVTGGLGALGSLVARWLASNGVRQLHLLGRSGKVAALNSSRSSSGFGELQRSGPSQVIVSQCDASSSADLAAVLASSAQLLPVEAVMHAGGVLVDATLQRQQQGGVRAVAAAKLAPVDALSALCQQQPVQSVVLFSSVASLLGSPGQANYAAANAGLDAAAAAAQLSGIPAVSVQWGAWAGSGMAAGDAQTAARVQRLGMQLISAAAGLAALEGIVAACSATLAVAAAGGVVAAIPFVWPRMLQRLPQPVPGFFTQFAAEGGPAAAAAAGWQQGQRRLVTAAQQQPQLSRQRVLEQVQTAIVTILGREVRAAGWGVCCCAFCVLAHASVALFCCSPISSCCAAACVARWRLMSRSWLLAWTRWALWSCATAWSRCWRCRCRPLSSLTTHLQQPSPHTWLAGCQQWCPQLRRPSTLESVPHMHLLQC